MRLAVLRTFALIVFAHPYCARKFMSQWRHVIQRFVGKYSTFGQSDNFAWILPLKEIGDPHFFLDTPPSLTNFCRFSKKWTENQCWKFIFLFLYPRVIEFHTV